MHFNRIMPKSHNAKFNSNIAFLAVEAYQISLMIPFIFNSLNYSVLLVKSGKRYINISFLGSHSTATSSIEGSCVPTTITNPTPSTCKCLTFVTRAGNGNCLKSSPAQNHCDMKFCYVAPGNTCLDLVESTTIPGLFYSAQACL